MKWLLSSVCAALLAPIAFGGGLVVTFDPPQKIEALNASEKGGEFFAATVGAVGAKEFSNVATVGLNQGIPKAFRAGDSSPFAVLKLVNAVTAQSLVFIWKEGVVTGYLLTKDEAFRIDFKKDADKGEVTKVDAKEVPRSDSFPQFRIPEKEGPFFIKAKDPAR